MKGEIHPVEEYVRELRAGEQDWIADEAELVVAQLEQSLANHAEFERLYPST